MANGDEAIGGDPLADEIGFHGVGTALSTRIEEQADTYSFLVDQLGIKGPVPSRR